MHGFELFRTNERTRWRLDDLPLGAIESAAVRPDSVAFARSALHEEGRTPATVRVLLDQFADDEDMTAFTLIWGRDELQHHFAFRAWLAAVGVDVAERPRQRQRATPVAGPTPSATLAVNVIEELRSEHLYRRAAEQIDEPVLRTILESVGRDEAGHACEFLHYAARRLEGCPQELGSVLRTLHAGTRDPGRERAAYADFAEDDGAADSAAHDPAAGLRPLKERAAERGEFDFLNHQIRRSFSELTGLDLGSTARIRRALQGAVA